MSAEVLELDHEASLPSWTRTEVAAVVAMLPGFAFKSANFVSETGEGLPLIRIRDLGRTTTAARYVGDFDETFVVRDGDILVGMDGEFAAVRWQGGKALLNQRVLKLTSARPEELDEGYLFYRVQPALLELEQSISGTTVKHLSTKDLKRLVWDLPPLDEQRRIAEILRSVDEAIATADSVEANAAKSLVRIRDALILEPNFDRVTIAEATAGGLFTDGDWVESKDQDPDGDVRLIQLADVGDGNFINKSRRFLTMEKAHLLRCTFLDHGDLLLARMPEPLGRCCLFPSLNQPCVTVVDVCVMRAGPATSNRYLAHALSTSEFRQQVLARASGTTRTRVSRGNLGTIEVPMPPIEHQDAVADVLDQLQEVANREKGAADRLRTIKQSLMSELLSGRVRAHP